MSAINLDVQIPIPGAQPVSGVITAPSSGFRPEKWAVIIAHGAGNDKNHSLLTALAEGLAGSGHLAMRFNFPYRDEGRKRPDGQKKLEQAWKAAFTYLQRHPQFRPPNIIAGGKSLGGRIASQLNARGELPAQRLIFWGYPLHAPGKKNEPRSSHFPDIAAPMLFFAGTRDALCGLDVLNSAMDSLSAPAALEIVEGGDHSFKVPKAMNLTKAQVQQDIVQRTLAWVNNT